jgi:hypothetical protein
MSHTLYAGKDLTEITDYIIEEAVNNATGANILAIEQLTYIVRMGLSMRDFSLPLTPATVGGVEDALQALLAVAYPGVRPREVRVNNVQVHRTTQYLEKLWVVCSSMWRCCAASCIHRGCGWDNHGFCYMLEHM